MVTIDLKDAVGAFEDASQTRGYKAFSQLLGKVSLAIGAKVSAAWKYNSREEYFSCYCRNGYSPEVGDVSESIHPSSSSLLFEILREASDRGEAVYVNIEDQDVLSRHWAVKAIVSLSLKGAVAIPFYNYSSAKKNALARGLIVFYFDKIIAFDDSTQKFLTFAFSQVYTNNFLNLKDEITNQIVEAFSTSLGSAGDDPLAKICEDILCRIFNVEACSIYEWNPHQSGFLLSSTTGLAESTSKKVYDRRGDGLISAVAELERTVSLKDIGDTDEFRRKIGRGVSAESINRNCERTKHRNNSVLFVPVFNPMSNGNRNISAVIKFVNKKLWHADIVDYFDDDDVILADEVATMMALYEEQSRSVRQQIAFALQFGHEAQAPAVGIRGTAERILLKLERDETEHIGALAHNIIDFSELLISFSESLAFGFGDRSAPMTQRYSFSQFNIRRSIDAAKRVVIPICRGEGISFDDIKIVGSFPIIFADHRAFMQIFYNLLTNAIKYRDRSAPHQFGMLISSRYIEKSDQISGSNTTFWKGWWKQATSASLINKGVHLLEVSDYGVGVPPDESVKVFLQGFRSPAIGATDIRGSGIGLSIVRNILGDFDGRIWLESNRDPTTFRIVLPDALESGYYPRRDFSRRVKNG